MATNWRDFAIPLDGVDVPSLLAQWKWLLLDPWRALTMTAFGDWFLENATGEVAFLDLVTGHLRPVARSRSEWEAMLEDPSSMDKWFMPGLVGQLRAQGLNLDPGQCYGYKLPPVLGGQLALDNIDCTDHLAHQSLLSQIHLGVKALPEGTRIGTFSSE